MTLPWGAPARRPVPVLVRGSGAASPTVRQVPGQDKRQLPGRRPDRLERPIQGAPDRALPAPALTPGPLPSDALPAPVRGARGPSGMLPEQRWDDVRDAPGPLCRTARLPSRRTHLPSTAHLPRTQVLGRDGVAGGARGCWAGTVWRAVPGGAVRPPGLRARRASSPPHPTPLPAGERVRKPPSAPAHRGQLAHHDVATGQGPRRNSVWRARPRRRRESGRGQGRGRWRGPLRGGHGRLRRSRAGVPGRRR